MCSENHYSARRGERQVRLSDRPGYRISSWRTPRPLNMSAKQDCGKIRLLKRDAPRSRHSPYFCEIIEPIHCMPVGYSL